MTSIETTVTRRREARARMLDEIYQHARRGGQSMLILAFVGLTAAGALLVVAFLIVGTAGEKGRMAAMPLGAAAIATAACSFFLRRAAQEYRRAETNRDFAALVNGIKYETTYWRISATCALVISLTIASPLIVVKITQTFAPEPALQTVSDMRVISAALEKYAARHHAYPNTSELAVLANVLRKDLQHEMPKVDGWGQPFQYRATCKQNDCFDYRLTSLGANGAAEVRVELLQEDGSYECNECGVSPEDLDIVHGGGRFLLLPKDLRAANE